MPHDFSAQEQLTDISTVSRYDVSRTVVGMAHFAGTGPDNTTCGGCAFWQTDNPKRKPICKKYRMMTGDDRKPVPHGTSSCRYFERRH